MWRWSNFLLQRRPGLGRIEITKGENNNVNK